MPTPVSLVRRARRRIVLRQPFLAVALTFAAAAACAAPNPTPSPTGSVDPSPVATPSSSPSTPTSGAIEHSTGTADVVLRIDRTGGFAPIDALATSAPAFTLFGNGVIVFQPRVGTFPEPGANGVTEGVPWRTAKLDEEQIQDLLEFAIGFGGLGAARDVYLAGGLADVPSTMFTIHAGGVDKTVVVSGLTEATEPGPDAAIRAQFRTLATRLNDFDDGGRLESDVYEPDRYRGVLIEREAQPGLEPLGWPWPGLTAADFPPGPPDGSGPTTFPHRTMLPREVAVLGLGGIEGGLQGLALEGPNGKLYTLVLRPLLPDERD